MELLGGDEGVDPDGGDACLSSPPPRLKDVAGAGLLLGGEEAAIRGVGWGGGFPRRRVAGSEEGELRAFRVQVRKDVSRLNATHPSRFTVT